MSMKSAIFTKAGEPLSIEVRGIPDPGPGQVLIKVARCGICGSDQTMTDPNCPVTFEVGAAPGHEYAGEVVAIGAGVDHCAIGDRVTAIPVTSCQACPACLAGDPYSCAGCRFVMGGFSEFTLAQADLIAKLPANLSFADGALVEPLACGAQAVRLGGVGAQSRALVIGAGPIGLANAFWARQAGCESIAVVAPSRRNEALAMAMGATHFLDQGADLPAMAAEALGGAPDVVFECAGKPGLISQAFDCVGPRGTVVSSGMCFASECFVPGFATFKQARLQFSMAYMVDDFRRSLAALDAGHLEPRAMITDTIPLEALPAMLENLRTDRNHCKVVVSHD